MCSMMGSVGASSFSTTMDMEEKAKGDERFLTGWTGGGSADEGTNAADRGKGGAGEEG
jgi:hypothetical protein